jgi:hypothetical protein
MEDNMNFESELAQTVIARLTEQQAMDILKDAGYRVTKARAPKAKATVPKLNAIGKPYSASYDPRYKIKHKVTPAYVGPRQSIGPNYIGPDKWSRMCELAQAQWNNDHKVAA